MKGGKLKDTTGLFDDEDDMFAETDRPKASNQAISKSLKIANLQDLASATSKTDGNQTEATGKRPWVQPHLVLRCLNSTLSHGKYANKLGVVQRLVEGGWGVELRMVESLDVVLLDQDECEPTLPKTGEPVLILAYSSSTERGSVEYVGKRGRFKEASPDGLDAVVELSLEGRNRLVSLPLACVCALIPL